MKKEILANCSREETRIALIEDEKVVELLFERRETNKIVGNIYKGRVNNIVPGISSAFVEIGLPKNAYLYISDTIPGAPELYTNEVHKQHHGHPKIEEMVKKGMDVMVQITKEAISDKGVKVSMDISLPGRNIVYMPFEHNIGISRQIQSRAERDRLKKIVIGQNAPGGFIVRTEAEGTGEKEIQRELQYLIRLWGNILAEYHKTQSGTIVHKDLGLTFQMVRDVLSDDVAVFMLDLKNEYEAVKEFVKIVSPELQDKVQLYQGKVPLFEAFGIEKEIHNLRKQKINLPSGGTIIIQEAESLCAIDVNTGKYKGKGSQDETIVFTNIEAAREIARQLRLRNIGGIIVIDFIDMRSQRDRTRVVNELKKSVANDKARIKILPITRLGLVEMTRERKRESIQSFISEECPECGGSGLVLSHQSIYIKVLKEIESLTQGRPVHKIKIALNPFVAKYFKERLNKLEHDTHHKVEIQENYKLSHQDYQIQIGDN